MKEQHEFFYPTALSHSRYSTADSRESLGMPSPSQPSKTNRNNGTKNVHINNYHKFLCASPLWQVSPRGKLRLTFWVVNHIDFNLKSDWRTKTVWGSQIHGHKIEYPTDQRPTPTSHDDKRQSSVNYLINKQITLVNIIFPPDNRQWKVAVVLSTKPMITSLTVPCPVLHFINV
jgi:hypothetical protein